MKRTIFRKTLLLKAITVALWSGLLFVPCLQAIADDVDTAILTVAADGSSEDIQNAIDLASPGERSP